jgi:hypothetical protein
MKHLCHLFMFSVALVVGASSAHGTTLLTTTLFGSNETPPNASMATGSALVILDSDNLDVNETFAGLTGGPASAAHIHCCAAPGVAAIVAVPFPNFPATTSGQYVNSFDLTVAGTYDAAFIAAHGGTVNSAKAALITALKTGQTYVNIHNATFPGGEIRGQLATTNTHDFNADGKSDVVWYNGTSGQVVEWLVNGTSVIGGGSPGSAPSPWGIVGQRDFNSDGFTDILWRNGTTGQVVIWLMNGTSVIGGGSPGTVTTDWSVSGTGDFNGDGHGDILWYNLGSGQVVLWFMNGAAVIGGGSPGTISPFSTAWTVNTGDFNGDGFTDILWFNQGNGQTVIWLLNGTTLLSSGSPGSVSVADGWALAGTGDFNGDGHSDILWRNSTSGQLVIWLLNGTSVVGAGSPGSAANPWAIAETGDFNGDSKSDILWYNTTTGQLVVWLLNGTSVVGGGSPGGAASPWVIQGMNAD